MLKRITVLLLIAVFVFAPSTLAAKTDDIFLELLEDVSKNDSTNKINAIEQLLFKLGIFEGNVSDYIHTDNIKFSDFKAAFTALLQFEEGMDNIEFQKKLYGVYCSKEEMLPSKITFDEVLYALVNMMECGLYAKIQNNYPSSVYVAAQNKKILDKVEYKSGKVPTKREFAYMIYNSLVGVSRAIESISEDSGTENTIEYGTTILLKERFNVDLIKGVVNAYGGTSLYKDENADEGKVNISGIIYDTEDVSFLGYVGSSVMAFIDCHDENRYKVISFEETARNKIMKINLSERGILKRNSFEYRADGKNRQLRLSDNAVLIYNGGHSGFVSSINISDYDLTESEYVLTDNNGDNKYDVVCAWKYHYFTVASVGSDKITFDYNMKYDNKSYISVNDQSTNYIYYSEDRLADSSCVSAGCSVGVAQSRSDSKDKVVSVVASNRKASGTIEELKFSDGFYKLKMNEKEYIVSPDYAVASGLTGKPKINSKISDLAVGTVAELSVTYDGIITSATETDGKFSYGYMVAVNSTGAFNDNNKIKIFNTDEQMVIYDFSENVLFNDGTSPISEKELASKVVNKIITSKSDYRNMVMYSLNSDGKVSELHLPYDNRGNVPGISNYQFTYDYSASSDEGSSNDDRRYYIGYIRLNTSPKYWCGQYGTLFIVPEAKDKDNDKYYSVEDIAQYCASNEYFNNIHLYGANDFYKVKYSVTYAKKSTEPSLANESVMITGISQALNSEGEPATQITYRKGNAEYDAYFENDTIVSTGGHIENISVNNLRVGDIIQFDTDTLGAITCMRLLFRLSDLNTTSYYYLGTEKIPFVEYALLKGMDTDDSLLKVSTASDENDASKDEIVRCGSFKNFNHFPRYYRYSKSGETIEPINFENLTVGNELVMVGSYGFAYEIYMITE